MSANVIIKRGILFVISIFVISLGIAFTKHSGLGVSPVSSVANILSLKITAVSFGMWSFIINFVFLIFEILILKKGFPPLQLMQIPLCLTSGIFIDMGLKLASLFPVHTYSLQFAALIIGIAILGLGITLSVIANVFLYPAEAFVKVVADKLGKSFGTLKIIFDVSCVTTSVILSLIMFGGQILGTREGTLISMILNGVSVKFFSALISKPLTKYINN